MEKITEIPLETSTILLDCDGLYVSCQLCNCIKNDVSKFNRVLKQWQKQFNSLSLTLKISIKLSFNIRQFGSCSNLFLTCKPKAIMSPVRPTVIEQLQKWYNFDNCTFKFTYDMVDAQRLDVYRLRGNTFQK